MASRHEMAGAVTPPVFLIDEMPSGSRVELVGDEARHALTVRRIRVGEQLALSDGRGGLAYCLVEAAEPGRHPRLELAVQARSQDSGPAVRVTLVQALAKGDRGELAVELATEAGIDEIVPWRAARSVARWDDGDRGDKALARWRNTARAAAKQARRAWIPTVTEPVDTDALAERIGRADLALALESDGSERIKALELPTKGEILFIVGPEGGISADELAKFAEAGAIQVRLGPAVLRTSTAAAVALGALGVLTSRWE
jgi:16S rRNA (uracil1498-N3)-methyltransferase